MNAFLALILLGSIAGGIYWYLEVQSTRDVKQTTLPATQIIRQAVQEIGTSRRWIATGHSADFASFALKRHANCLIGLLFACFGLIPGIIYMMVGSRTESLTINVFPEPDGTSSVQVSASGRHASSRGRAFLRALPGTAGAIATSSGPQALEPPPPQPPLIDAGTPPAPPVGVDDATPLEISPVDGGSESEQESI